MRAISCFLTLLLLAGCTTRREDTLKPDSITTYQAIERTQGKHMQTKRGPADVLGDTTTNQRHPPIVQMPQ